jgi:O-6-methylguanine DNA methyltransferase
MTKKVKLLIHTDFAQKVYRIVKKIPKGKVLTYKEVASRAGKPKAYRAVGNILNKNYDPKIPCHRVIRSDGKIGGYNRGVVNKRKILKKEGANLKV